LDVGAEAVVALVAAFCRDGANVPCEINMHISQLKGNGRGIAGQQRVASMCIQKHYGTTKGSTLDQFGIENSVHIEPYHTHATRRFRSLPARR
jgi:hypothetical protein